MVKEHMVFVKNGVEAREQGWCVNKSKDQLVHLIK